MKTFARIVAMSIMLMLAACGGGSQTPTTKVYTNANNGQTITIPANVSNLTLLSGQGGTGNASYREWVTYWSEKKTTYNQRNDQGGIVNELDGGTTYGYTSPVPTSYCGPNAPYSSNGVINYTQTCYTYTDMSFWYTNPATTGATSTMTGPNGFSKSWVGGNGGPATSTSEANVTVVPGGQYVLNIPPGGSITLSYYE